MSDATIPPIAPSHSRTRGAEVAAYYPATAETVSSGWPPLDDALDSALRAIEDAANALRQKTRRADTDTHRALAHTISASAHRLRRLVADARDLREAQSPSAPFHPEPVELGDMMMDLMAEQQQTIPSYQFELALPGELPLVTVDPARIRQALSALLRFAVEMSAPGDTVRVAVRSDDESLILAARTYRGQFTHGALDTLLQPCARIALSSEVVVSLGLELALTQALVAMHGGSMRLESAAPEMGLVAHISLPRLPLAVRRPTPALSAPLTAVEYNAQSVSGRREVGVLLALRDQRLARYLRANLEAEHYHCWVAADQREAERKIELEDPDLVLLDSGLTGELRTEETLRHLRSLAGAEFVMLAPRHNPVECATLLNHGAADYLVVPLSIDELLARLHVVLRSRDRAVAAAQAPRIVQTGDVVIDIDRRSVTVAGRQVALSKTEFKLLRALAEHMGIVLSHEMLLARVWGPGYGQEVEFAWVYVRRLRKKIEADPAHPRYILTVPGVGYKLAVL